MSTGEITLVLTPREAEGLGLALANDVIGNEIDDIGIAAAFNDGLDLIEPYWGRKDFTQKDIGDIVSVTLINLGGFEGAVQKWMDVTDMWTRMQGPDEE